MKKYDITLVNDYGKQLYRTTVDAENEQDALIKARKEAESNGKELPDEVWVRFR